MGEDGAPVGRSNAAGPRAAPQSTAPRSPAPRSTVPQPAAGRRASPPVPGFVRWLKLAVVAGAAVPLSTLVRGALADDPYVLLGTNPLETITHATGFWTLVFLVATLAVTPVRRLTGQGWLLRLRRTLGLLAFAWGTMHLATFVWFDHFFDWAEIVKDVAKRPFVTLGFLAWLAMVPLALTSSDRAIRALGRNWSRLHRLVYLTAALGALHWLWLVKRITLEPAAWALAVALLLGLRLAWALQARRRRHQAATAPSLRGS